MFFNRKSEDDFIAGMDTDQKWRARMEETTEIKAVNRNQRRQEQQRRTQVNVSRATQETRSIKSQEELEKARRMAELRQMEKQNWAELQERQQREGTNDANTVMALILGIFSILLCTHFMGIPSIIVSRIGKSRAKRAPQGAGKGLAKILCAFGFIAGWLVFISVLVVVVLLLVNGASEGMIDTSNLPITGNLI